MCRRRPSSAIQHDCGDCSVGTRLPHPSKPEGKPLVLAGPGWNRWRGTRGAGGPPREVVELPTYWSTLLHRERRALRGGWLHGRAGRIRRHRQRPRRADGYEHVFGALHADLAARPDPARPARDVVGTFTFSFTLLAESRGLRPESRYLRDRALNGPRHVPFPGLPRPLGPPSATCRRGCSRRERGRRAFESAVRAASAPDAPEICRGPSRPRASDPGRPQPAAWRDPGEPRPSGSFSSLANTTARSFSTMRWATSSRPGRRCFTPTAPPRTWPSTSID